MQHRQILERWQDITLVFRVVIHLISGVKFHYLCFTSASVKVQEYLKFNPKGLGWSLSYVFSINFLVLALETS